jgi:AraC-like DNA-binding protein
MTIILSRQEDQDIINRGYQVRSQYTGELEHYIDYPEQLGRAYRWKIDLPPGVKLGIEDHCFSQSLIIKQPEREHPIELSFYMAGNYHFNAQVFGNGICPQGELTYFANQRSLAVNLHIQPEIFETLLLQDSSYYPKEIKFLLRERTEWLYTVSGEITPTIKLVLQQILNCPYHGYLKRLYLESKALELISLQLGELFDSPHNTSKQLKGSDHDCIHHAREILDKHLYQAPTLMELSRQVGLNKEKLKNGFQQLFQTTPFQYLRDRRLEQAKHLLLDTNQSVEEVAHAVGYANRSKFASAFRKKFGVNPKSYRCDFCSGK